MHSIDQTNSATTPGPPASINLRRVALSPAREYLRRPGQTEPIGHDLAALIASRTGKADLTLKGITVDLKGLGRRIYHHPDHPLVNDFSRSGPLKIIYAINMLNPSIAHILSTDGRYLGTLPEAGKVAVFDTEAASAALAGKKRQINRLGEHLQRVHAIDTQRALAIAEHNAAEMSRIVQALPAPEASNGREAKPATAAQIGDATRAHVTAQRHRDTARRNGICAIMDQSRDTEPMEIHSDRLPTRRPAHDPIEIINPFA